MFGYVTVNEPELKIKDYKKYRSYYCGICGALKDNFGLMARMSLNFDMTFLAILLDGVYEPSKEEIDNRCIVHPVQKHKMVKSDIVDYAAKMNVMLTYYKMLDDWNDDKKATRYAYAKTLEKSCRKIADEYPQKADRIKENLDKLSNYESENIKDIDLVAGSFGELTACVFEYEDDVFKDNLSKMGFYLGKFIYIMDAYDDIEKDIEKKEYNPFVDIYAQEDFDEKVKELLTMMMSECARAFEMLPIIENVDILRNIIYSGVWAKYEQIYEKRHKQK